MAIEILIKDGSYRNEQIVNEKFTLVKGFAQGQKGGYVTVKNSNRFPGFPEYIKIKVEGIKSYTLGNQPNESVNDIVENDTIAEPEVVETDAQVMANIDERFEMLDELADAAFNGDITALIVQGPPGVGKSYGVLTQLEKNSLFDEIAGRPVKYEIVKGAATPLGLYAKLYKHSDAGHVIVFDDIDCLFYDDLSLNLLKAALDSSKKRRICWNSDSSLLRREGIPDSFDFKGTVIFITNLNFKHIRSKTLQGHLEALQSRCHFIDLGIEGKRGMLLRIQQIVDKGMLDSYNFTDEAKQEVVDFIKDNADRIREISLRMVIKIADLMKLSPSNWRRMAQVTTLR
jgi:predicted AAA+ superfamily ATPase